LDTGDNNFHKFKQNIYEECNKAEQRGGFGKHCHVRKQEAQLSPSDRAMRLVSSNLANCHATVQKLLIRQVLTKPMV